jgi:putative toxin-antitoxin system antitoxin component (TIGR02293 family)
MVFQMVQQVTFDEMVKVFGGRKSLGGGSLRSYFDFDRVIHEGLPVSAFRHAVDSLEQPEKTVVEGIGISRTTLGRRKQAGRLGFVDSERAVRLGAVIALGRVALGSTRAVGRWLLKANSALGGEIPIRLLQTDIGARQVEAVLGRALLGGFS